MLPTIARWQRVFARGSEVPQTARELHEWTARHQALENLMSAELRRPPLRNLPSTSGLCGLDEVMSSVVTEVR